MGCIYKITEKSTGKVYIGQTQSARRRKAQYRYLTKNRDMYHKQERRFISLLYGRDFDNDFTFEVIEDNIVGQTNLNEREIYWIKVYKSNNPKYGYNMSQGGGGTGIYPQSIRTAMYMKSNRKQAVYLYDTKERRVIMYMSCASVGEDLGCNDEMVAMAARTLRRLRDGRYFVFFVNYDYEKKYIDKYFEEREETFNRLCNRKPDQNTAARLQSAKNYAALVLDAYYECLLFSKDYGYIDYSKSEIKDIINAYRERLEPYKAQKCESNEFRKPLYVYDTKDRTVTRYDNGSEEVSKKLNKSHITIEAGARRGNFINGRYHIYYVDDSKRDKYTKRIQNLNNYTSAYEDGLRLIAKLNTQ